ncbi:SHQ1 protein [Phytophthora cactorum]|nr:SHQ1 protein [Phytophthora cactorum]
MEFYVDGLDFTFYCKPYLLKLHFPHEVVDDDLAKAVYDPNKENGTIVVHLPKKEPGQDFPDLDMLTKLLQPQRPPVDIKTEKQRAAYRSTDSAGSAPIGTFQEENERLNALIDGKPVPSKSADGFVSVGPRVLGNYGNFGSIKLDAGKDDTESIGVRVTDLAPSYGFNNAYSDFFRVWHGEVSEILSLPDPEHIQPEQRRILREGAEEQMFDIERYLMDFANQGDDMYFELAMAYEPFWRKYPVLPPAAAARKKAEVVKPLIVEVDSDVNHVGDSISSMSLEATASQPPPAPSASSSSGSSITFTDAEQELLLRLPRKEFLLPEGSPEEKLQLTTQGDSGVESTWTVSIVSPTLSWLDSNADLRAVVRSTVRRMITFPFLRQYDLAMRSVREASEILKRGKRVVLRALLTLYRIVEKSETQYLLNSLYFQDYCVWIQSVNDERLKSVSESTSSSSSDSDSSDDSEWNPLAKKSPAMKTSVMMKRRPTKKVDEKTDAYKNTAPVCKAPLLTRNPGFISRVPATELKLPLLLTARPGNVGVQIDAHRAMDLFTHPRSATFTSQFHEIMYENGSLENYSRVVERTVQRARLLEDKLEKLRAREQYLLEDEAKRKQRRIQREAARQRRIWQMHQAAKRADERARETAAAITVQKVIRGALARRVARVLRQVRETHEAALMVQHAMKGYVARQHLERERERRAREEEECREREIHSAAAVLQRQARKRLKIVQEARQQAALAACIEDEEDEDESEDEGEDTRTDERPNDLSADEKIIADALRRGISLDSSFLTKKTARAHSRLTPRPRQASTNRTGSQLSNDTSSVHHPKQLQSKTPKADVHQGWWWLPHEDVALQYRVVPT